MTTSISRSVGNWPPSTLRPPRISTSACSGVPANPAAVAANCAAESLRSVRISCAARVAPAAMSASRASGEAYMALGAPVTAQLTRFVKPSALRAMCDRTCARVQPSHRLARLMASSSRPAAVAMSRLVSCATSERFSDTCEDVFIRSRYLSALSVGAHTIADVPEVTASPPRYQHDRLIVRGAREHNLRDISVDLPRNSLIVFTGLSGSGKSSLAFDTIFAEGQRRYVE